MDGQGAVLVGIACLSLVVFILHDWRVGVWLAFGALLLEDVARKLLPGDALWVQLLRDGLIGLTYLSMLFHVAWGRRSMPRIPLVLLYSGFAAWVLLMLTLSPAGPLGKMVVLRNDLFYVPMVCVGLMCFRDMSGLSRFSRALCWFAVPIAVTATAQILLGYDGVTALMPEALESLFLPGAAAHLFHSHYKGSVPLAAAWFLSADRMAFMSLILTFLAGALAVNGDRRAWLLMSAGLLAVLLSGRRLILLVAVVGMLTAVQMSARLSDRTGQRIRGIRRGLMLGAGVAALLVVAIFPYLSASLATWVDFFAYTLTTEIWLRAGWLVDDTLRAVHVAGALGQGVGTYGQVRLLSPNLPVSTGVSSDSGIVMLLVEGGPLHLLAYCGFWTCALAAGLSAVRDTRGTHALPHAVTLAALQIAVIFVAIKGHPTLSDSARLMPFWFFTGVLMWLKTQIKDIQ